MMGNRFRIIIVGAGPVGLIAAHAFSAAGIDFVLLERRDTVVAPDGSSLAIYPHTLRVMDQLHLIEPLSNIKSTMKHAKSLTHEGVCYNTAYTYDWCMENHGIGMWFFHRPELLQTLYDMLSDNDKARIKTTREVADIETTRDGVTVLCADGSSEQGSIVIGADGVSSVVRNIMRRRALEEDPDALVNDEKPFLATYRAMWGTVPMIQSITGSESWDTRGYKLSSQLFLGRGRGWFFVYEKLEDPTRDWKRYSQEDKDEYAKKFGEVPMTDTVKFRDIYAASHSCGMSDLGEGMLKTLSWNRIALVGDAGTKHAPNFGLGFNSGVQDVVNLANGLRQMVRKSSLESFDANTIRQVFQNYELTRRDDALRCLQTAAAGARLHAWDSLKIWVTDRWIVPLKGTNKQIFADRMSTMFSRGLVLDFLKENQVFTGTIPWVHHPHSV